jgi:hypothetical protein
MVDMFAQLIFSLRDLGFFNFFLPFLLTSAIFYGLLRKSKVFGERAENVAVNGVVAIVAAMMVWGYPLIGGFDIETEMSRFFTHAMFITLSFLVGILTISIVLPKEGISGVMGDFLKENKGGIIIFVVIGLLAGIILFATSGFMQLIFGPVLVRLSDTALYTIGGILLLVLPLIFILRGSDEDKE